MAVIASRKKQVRKSAQKTIETKMSKTKLKSSIKKFHNAVAEGDKDLALTLLNKSVSIIDRSVNKNAHNKSFANRKKSTLHKAYNKLEA